MPCKSPMANNEQMSNAFTPGTISIRHAIAQQPFCSLDLIIPCTMSVEPRILYLSIHLANPRSPNRSPISTASIVVHHHVFLPAVFLHRCSWRQVSRHARHQSLCVLPLSRRSFGRVAGLLCERMSCLLTRGCGLLLGCRSWEARSADVRLGCTRGRRVARFGQAFLGFLEFRFELF
jgi:hypothetical protein